MTRRWRDLLALRRVAVKLGLVPVLVGAALLALSAPADGASVQVTPAGGVQFPQRALLVSGQGIPALTASDVHIVENGVPVHGLKVQTARQSGGGSFGVVVVIDVTPTAASIRHAETISRDISTLRPPGQEFGLVLADNSPPVFLAMTRNPAAIQAAFSAPITITHHGEHLWNAALTGVDLLASSKIKAGSVIVLSDGADRGDPATLNQLVAAASAAHVRIFTIGIPSPRFYAPTLQGMASRTGGQFYEAPFSQLRGIFDSVESRLTQAYLITYYSVQGPGRSIPASIHIDGVPGTYDISYTSPALTTAKITAPHPSNSFWSSSAAALFVALACVLLLLVAGAALFRRRGRRASVRERVGGFLPRSQPETAEVLPPVPATNPVFDRTQRVLEGARWWPRFQEEVDIAQIDRTPIEILFLTTAGSLLAAAILYVGTGSPWWCIPVLIAGPVIMRVWVRQLMRRQQRRFSLQLGEHLQEVASAMRAGRSLVDALALVTQEASEPTKREFSRALADEALGVPLDEALTPIVHRMDNEDMQQVCLVAALDRTTGASTSEVLDRVADGIRENTEIRRELRTLTAQARLSRWILTGLPIFLLVFISLADPVYERPMYHTTAGIVLLILSGIMVTAGSLVMARLIKIDL